MSAPIPWHLARCAGASPRLFEGGHVDWDATPPEDRTRAWHEARGRIEVAKAICAACPIEDECRDYAVDTLVGWYWLAGLWGRTTDGERERIRVARRAARTEAA